MWKFGSSLLSEREEDDLLGDEAGGLFSLSPLQRIYAFAAALVVGLILMFLSLLAFAKPIKFAIVFTLGNVLAVGSTAFLIGPGQQIRMMFDPVRVYASAIYIGCVVLALICALWVESFWTWLTIFPNKFEKGIFLILLVLKIHNKLLTVLAIICEICALIWYSLSYIPFARRMASELIVSCCDTEI